MKALALTITAAALLPATAWAGWNTYSYAATQEVAQDIRNTLTRWCSVNAGELQDLTQKRIEDACGPVFDRTTLHGQPVYYAKTYDEENLRTASRWTFALANSRKAYMFSLIDETEHASAERNRLTDTTRTRLEVLEIIRGQEDQPIRLTAANAWRGSKSGQRARDDRDPPTTDDRNAGLARAIRDLQQLRFMVRESYRIQ